MLIQHFNFLECRPICIFMGPYMVPIVMSEPLPTPSLHTFYTSPTPPTDKNGGYAYYRVTQIWTPSLYTASV